MRGVKVGDRVRGTCNDSVIVGTVSYVYPKSVSVAPDGDDNLYYLVDGVWTVEVIPAPIPDVVGAIVRDKDGDAWQRCEDGWHLAGTDPSPLPLDRLRNCAPFTVLWTPTP